MKQKVVLSLLFWLIVSSTLLPWVLIPKHDEISGGNRSREPSTSQASSHETSIRASVAYVGSNKTSSDIFHFLVSSRCNRDQWWQVVTQIYSAKSVGQEGKYTWIVSGCDREMEDQLVKVFESHFHPPSQEDLVVTDLHITPDYSNMSVYGGPFADGKATRTFLNRLGKIQRGSYGNRYHFNNKPNGLRHWAEKHKDELPNRNDLIVLLDPDFLFVSRFSLPLEAKASPGTPAGAWYALNGDGIEWVDLNVSVICGEDSPCTNVTLEEHRRHYSAGPPYVMHSHDVLALSTVWSKFVPPTYDQYPSLYAEMFAYSMASAHLELRHNLVKRLQAGCMVPWPLRKDIGDAGPSAEAFVTGGADMDNPVWDGPSSCFLPPFKPPPLLHYCQRYAFEATNASSSYYYVVKRRVPHAILECENPKKFLTPFASNNSEVIVGDNQKWTALTTCAILRAVNYARREHCENATANQ